MPQCQLHHLAFTLPAPITDVDLPRLVRELFNIEGLDPATVRLPRGRNGFREAYSLTGEHGAELISILLDGVSRNSKGTAHFVVHGDALDMDGIDVPHLCREIIRMRGWGTRLDLAADEHKRPLPWEKIVECCRADQWENRITTTTCRPRRDHKTGGMVPSPPVYLREVGESLYFGKHDSDLSICMYTRRGPVRVETRIRNRAAATDIIRRIAEGEDINVITAGILRRNLKFHVFGYGRKDRRPVCDWWEQFLGNVIPLKLPRQRENRHRNPWYIPPTRADRVEKAVGRHLAGASAEDTAAILRVVRRIMEDHDTDTAVAAFAA